MYVCACVRVLENNGIVIVYSIPLYIHHQVNTIIYITLPKHHQNYFATMHKTQAIPCSHSAISAAPYTFCARKTHTIRHLHTFGLETNMDENARNVQIILMLNYSSLCATSCMKSETLRAYSSALGEQSALREGSALPQRRRMCIIEAKPPARFGNIRFAALIANLKLEKKRC